MRQTGREAQPQSVHTPSFESAPWVARELVLEEPGQPRQDPPLVLAQNEHVVDAPLDGDAIRREQ
jgi:hypothetical protein